MKKSTLLFVIVFLSVLNGNAQNTCAAALVVNAGLTTVGDINGTDIPSPICASYNGVLDQGTAGEWYTYTPSQNYSITISSDLISNTGKDTRFHVYSGTCGNLSCFNGDDDSGVIGNGYLSIATFNVIGGTTYYIAWDNRWNSSGFDFQLSEAPFVINPCTTATPVTAGFTTVTAIDNTNLNTTCSSASLAKWFVYQPTQNHTVTITSDLAINRCKDTNFSVYTGICPNVSCLVSDDNSGIIACDFGNMNSYLSKKTFNVAAGMLYYIVWDNKWSADGFVFQLIENPIAPPPFSFTPTTISINPGVACSADMNGDYLDDIVQIGTNQITILTQIPTGGFNTNTYPLPGLTATASWSIAAGDIDRNGFNDLVFGDSSRLTTIKSNATGTGYIEFPYPQNIFTQRTNFVDINNDGNLDLWACHDVAQSHAYRNDGAGNLTFDISLMPTLAVGGNYQSTWTDYDNDGDLDMYLAKCRAGAPANDPQRINLLYRNNGNGTFTEVAAAAGVNDGAQSWSTAIEDFDNDGDLDILMSNISDANRFYKNNGDGTFTDVYNATGIEAQVGSWELQAADFNNDGWMDFIWQNSTEIYINNGDFTFTGYDAAFNQGAIGDFNDDGFLDVQNGNTIYSNVPNANNWVKVNLNGITSNKNGIGARVEIYGAWGKQIREIRSGSGFRHQSTLNACFGLGTATAITKIIVRWPSGTLDTYLNPPIKKSIFIIEGSSVLDVNSVSNAAFSLYPNPVEDFLTIKNNNSNSALTEFVQIIDASGKIINSRIENQTIDVRNIAKGVYILGVKDFKGNKFSLKFIKK